MDNVNNKKFELGDINHLENGNMIMVNSTENMLYIKLSPSYEACAELTPEEITQAVAIFNKLKSITNEK